MLSPKESTTKPEVVALSASLSAKFFFALMLVFFCPLCFARQENEFAKGVAAFNSGNYAQAAGLFENCKSLGAASGDLYYFSGITYERLGKYDLATTNYLTVVRNFPGTQAAHLANLALQRPSFLQTVGRPAESQTRNPGLDFYPKETWVPFQRVRNSLVVEASINGRTTQMLFDTGASSCTATINQLQSLGIDPPAGKPSGYAGGVGSTHRLPAWTLLVDLKLGKIERKQFPITVIDSQISMPLLGENFYHDLEYTIDAKSSAISFKTRNNTTTFKTASCTKGGVTVGPDGRYVYNVPFTMEGKSLVVTAKIDGQPCQMIFDTGADISLFTARQVQELGLHIQPTGRNVPMGGISGRTLAPIVVLKNVQLGPIDTPLVCAVSDNATMPRPLLGQNFFKDYPYTIDNANGVIKFEKK